MGWFIPQSSSSWLSRQIGPLPTRVWCHLRQPDASCLQRFALSLTHTFRRMLLSFLQSPRRALFGNLLCRLAYSHTVSGRMVATRLFSELPRRVLLGNWTYRYWGFSEAQNEKRAHRERAVKWKL